MFYGSLEICIVKNISAYVHFIMNFRKMDVLFCSIRNQPQSSVMKAWNVSRQEVIQCNLTQYDLL